MKFIGHTMATPGMEILDALDIFKNAGLDGIEIVTQANTVFTPDIDVNAVDGIIKKAASIDMEIAALTPYYWDINNIDDLKAKENINGMLKVIDLAKKMGAGFVRAYGGRDKAGGTDKENYNNLVKALKEISSYAAQKNICIILENHPGTVTRTGRQTYEVIRDVNNDFLKALYDPANVLHDTDEKWEDTLNIQKDVIGYVHVKDFYYQDGKRKACLVGEGIVPWKEILKKLKWYDGYFSFEYEKRWYPDDLEDADTGIGKCLEYIKKVIL